MLDQVIRNRDYLTRYIRWFTVAKTTGGRRAIPRRVSLGGVARRPEWVVH
jgi:hypothetical protein